MSLEEAPEMMFGEYTARSARNQVHLCIPSKNPMMCQCWAELHHKRPIKSWLWCAHSNQVDIVTAHVRAVGTPRRPAILAE